MRIKLLHSDDVDEGWIEEIYNRDTQLLRPPVANVDQVVIVFSMMYPDPHINLLDKLICIVEHAGLNPIICLNKVDIDGAMDVAQKFKQIYELAGYQTIISSYYDKLGIEKLKELLKDKISVFAGPSGVGKSSLLNLIQEGLSLKTGVVSEKIHRGKHTTRHTQLFKLTDGGWVLDTPGFTSVDITKIPQNQLMDLFIEFHEYMSECKFQNCMHIHEPSCGVKKAVELGKINQSRYNSYKYFLNEIKESRNSYD